MTSNCVIQGFLVSLKGKISHKAVLQGKIKTRLEGLEPPTTRFRKPVLYPLSYKRIWI